MTSVASETEIFDHRSAHVNVGQRKQALTRGPGERRGRRHGLESEPRHLRRQLEQPKVAHDTEAAAGAAEREEEIGTLGFAGRHDRAVGEDDFVLDDPIEHKTVLAAEEACARSEKFERGLAPRESAQRRKTEIEQPDRRTIPAKISMAAEAHVRTRAGRQCSSFGV